MKKIDLRFGIIVVMILAAAFSRLIPHPWDFTPIGAIALFGAAYFSNRFLAFAIPLISLWLSDVLMYNTVYSSFHHKGLWLFPEAFPWQYVGFALVALVGFGLLRKLKLSTVIGASLSASVIFFLVSNFGCWIGNALYPQNIGGLTSCYAAGLPFFANTVAGDLFFCGLLFGVFELAKYKFPVLQVKNA